AGAVLVGAVQRDGAHGDLTRGLIHLQQTAVDLLRHRLQEVAAVVGRRVGVGTAGCLARTGRLPGGRALVAAEGERLERALRSRIVARAYLGHRDVDGVRV